MDTLDGTDERLKEIQTRLQAYMKAHREHAKKENYEVLKDDDIIRCEERRYFEGTTVKSRVVIFLRGTGCSRAESCGGCTFCGFYNATKRGNKVSGKDYLAQLHKSLKEWDPKVTKLCCYNDGSLLCDSEIDFDTVMEIFREVNKLKNIEEITIEAKVEDITEEKVKALRECFDRSIEIAVGFESANPLIRDICVNKSFENSKFERDVEIAKKFGIDIIPLIMAKPPFLTEKEAADDLVNSLTYLEQFHLKRIDIELPTVEYDTLTFDLWSKDAYVPLNLWTLAEILKIRENRHMSTRLYISPMQYTVDAHDYAFSCYKCIKIFIEAIKKFNQTQDPSVFTDISCVCKEKWANQYNTTWDVPLADRVDTFLRKRNY